MLIVGDLHGKYNDYLALLTRFSEESSVQIGDFGFGFRPVPTLPKNAHFFRGNHDSPDAARSNSHYLGDYGIREIDGVKFFFLGGAWSIDYKWRTEGISWWRDEELSCSELTDAVALYEKEKPDIVLSHDGPHQATDLILARLTLHKERPINTRTGSALTHMFRIHQPKTWIFGHWHVNWNENILGTEFRCLGELGFTHL
jgi:hypothetical protein